MPEKEYLSALIKISDAITSDLYIEEVLKLIVTETAVAMSVKICVLWLLNRDTGELNICVTQAMNPEYLKEYTFKLGDGSVGLAARDKKPVAVINAQDGTSFKEKELAKKENVVSILNAPLSAKGKNIGVISCYTGTEREFTKSDIDLLRIVANQAAAAIENTKLIAQTENIQKELETRKKVEKAKGILMRDQLMTEEKAYSLIRKSSMNKCLPMKAIAEAIILSSEIRSGG